MAHQTGLPVLRPLVLEYQDDPAVYGVDLEYLLGAELLVAPVFEAGATQRRVYPLDGRAEFTLHDDGGACRLAYRDAGEQPLSVTPESGLARPRRRYRLRVAGRPGETTINDE